MYVWRKNARYVFTGFQQSRTSPTERIAAMLMTAVEWRRWWWWGVGGGGENWMLFLFARENALGAPRSATERPTLGAELTVALSPRA